MRRGKRIFLTHTGITQFLYDSKNRECHDKINKTHSYCFGTIGMQPTTYGNDRQCVTHMDGG
jgi:hypothetical protein